MMTDEITIKIPNLTSEQCGDVAITAAEGGIGYWCQIESYNWKRWSNWTEFDLNDPGATLPVADDFVFYTIREWDDEDNSYSGNPIDITPTLLRRGYKLFMENGRRLDDQEDPSAMDANEADLVVQLGAFGEVNYG